MSYDKIIIGAGLYGLYAANFCAEKGEKVLVLEYDKAPFMRATYINQARVHMGYHYPRSISTATKSAHYFDRFNKDYGFCIYSKFDQIYATSAAFSWTDAEQFKSFCENAGIYCEEVNTDRYFNKGMCDGAFLTKEYTYDAQLLKQYFRDKLIKYTNVTVEYGIRIKSIIQKTNCFDIHLNDGRMYSTDFLVNATYASSNQIISMMQDEKLKSKQYEAFKIKYELCEIILCEVSENLKDTGITVMDGPFFSIMPFGKTAYHSLTAVTFTPHVTSYDNLPKFECQEKAGDYCSSVQLGNCNDCPVKPQSAWYYMSQMARKYLKTEYGFKYKKSLFSVKPILQASEIDDSRPTVVRKLSNMPVFISVLSGKINTVYDLDEVL
ncbi:FAD-dependent oxidoreductase [Pectinatus haikarae]|uniref:FAD-dependent oxidoreductase n=1 Tax=Pectinatus haikarae TaxID=349096 RepID=UPI0018C48815|nr:FAD-dependent oxidoreductase [Pectinatus haikarae]